MLKIENLKVAIDNKTILDDLSLNINAGEVHAIMGHNGSGKSTLVNFLAGHPSYTQTGGQCLWEGRALENLSISERAHAGIFLGFQYPTEIPGVNNAYFMRTALNAKRKAKGEAPIDAYDFLTLAKQALNTLGMDADSAQKFLKRDLNTGLSGGEKKRNEICQMMLMQPQCCLLDEIDSGLDIDALQHIADGINHTRDKTRSIVLVTHYQRLLNYVKPDIVHIMVKGKIVKTGDADLAHYLEKNGYAEWTSEGL